MIILLNPDQTERSIIVGKKRQSEAVRRGYKDKHGFKGDGEAIHINGAGGECAFAEAIGAVWEGHVNTFKSGGDVLHYQVRTRSEHWHDLLIRDDDDPSKIYVRVTGKLPEYFVSGWIVGHEARKAEWRKDYGSREEAWFVPKEHLHPLSTLPGYTPRVIQPDVPEPPDLQEWVEKYGGYRDIPWEKWDVLMGQFHMERRFK